MDLPEKPKKILNFEAAIKKTISEISLTSEAELFCFALSTLYYPGP